MLAHSSICIDLLSSLYGRAISFTLAPKNVLALSLNAHSVRYPKTGREENVSSFPE